MQIGRYQLHDRIAEGVLSDVHRAELRGDAGFARALIVRRLRDKGDAVLRDTFVHEARSGAVHEHPHIAQVYDLGVEDGSFYLVTEFIEGVTLEQLLGRAQKRGEPIPTELVVWAFRNIAEAVHHTHNAFDPETRAPLAIVHRDLQPSSIMVSDAGQVKLLSFGMPSPALPPFELAARLAPDRIRYLPPERIISGPLDPRSDVYTLGALLLEMTTGERWYGGLQVTEVIRRILSGDPPAPQELDPFLDPELGHIIAKATLRHPSRRYASAGELSDALAGWLRGRTAGVGPRVMGDAVQRLAADLCRRPWRAPPSFAEEDVPKTIPISPEDALKFFDVPKTRATVEEPAIVEKRDSFDFNVEYLAKTLHGFEEETVRLNKGRKLLWAVPDEGTWSVAKQALDRLFKVDFTTDFLDACLKLLAREYDVAVIATDLSADGLDGYDLSRLVRGLLPAEQTPLWATSVPNPGFPLVLLDRGTSAHSDAELAHASFAVMKSPIDIDGVVETVGVLAG